MNIIKYLKDSSLHFIYLRFYKIISINFFLHHCDDFFIFIKNRLFSFPLLFSPLGMLSLIVYPALHSFLSTFFCYLSDFSYFINFLHYLLFSGGPLPEELLPQVKVPVRILWGENDPWEPIEMGRAAYGGFPCVDEFVTLPGALSY